MKTEMSHNYQHLTVLRCETFPATETVTDLGTCLQCCIVTWSPKPEGKRATNIQSFYFSGALGNEGKGGKLGLMGKRKKGRASRGKTLEHEFGGERKSKGEALLKM